MGTAVVNRASAGAFVSAQKASILIEIGGLNLDRWGDHIHPLILQPAIRLLDRIGYRLNGLFDAHSASRTSCDLSLTAL